jgi:hypothetical protein
MFLGIHLNDLIKNWLDKKDLRPLLLKIDVIVLTLWLKWL